MGSRVRDTSVLSEIGLRPKMEDRYALVEGAGGLFGGVYDGHGGAGIADLVAMRLHGLFFGAVEEGLAPEAAFLRAYEQMDREARSPDCGSTAATFFIRGDQLAIAHLGDARMILVGEEETEPLTEDHRVDHPKEQERVLRAGAEIDYPYVLRGWRGLMPTRSFGDTWFRAIGVIATPDVASRRLGASDRYLVAACDGLWDVLDNERVAEIVRGARGAERAVNALAEIVFARGGTDNLTVIVVEFNPAD
ncbi:MAG: PP2C family serine/threonine-protein phosphatase [Candidatus Methylomirabilia bacterium]